MRTIQKKIWGLRKIPAVRKILKMRHVRFSQLTHIIVVFQEILGGRSGRRR
jgi:hypothetical protein